MSKAPITTADLPVVVSVDEAFDALAASLSADALSEDTTTTTTTEETVVSNDAQSKTAALSALIEQSATASGAGESAAASVSGYEAAYATMLGGFAAALASGNTENDIRKALQADQKQSGTVHIGSSADACQTLTSLAAIHGLEGDLPAGYVYRAAAKNGGVGLLEGEESLTALVRAVRAPADTAILKEQGAADLYGKAVVTKIIAAAETKADAVEGLLKARAAIAAVLKEAKKAEQTPKDALKFLKAASGPLGKVEEALDAGLIGDADEVRTLIAALIGTLSAAEKHAALVAKAE